MSLPPAPSPQPSSGQNSVSPHLPLFIAQLMGLSQGDTRRDVINPLWEVVCANTQ